MSDKQQKVVIREVHISEGHAGWQRTQKELKKLGDIKWSQDLFREMKQACENCAKRSARGVKTEWLKIVTDDKGKHFSADIGERTNGQKYFLIIVDNGQEYFR